MLSVKSINVAYGDFQALSDVSIDVRDGEIVALLGSNGAGKTTTINTISGVTDLKSGSIAFDGVAMNDLPAHERVSHGIVQVPEGRKLFPGMTVLDNLIIGSYVPKARNARQQTLEMVFTMFPKLSERRNQQAGSLSGGEQQMCAIGRGLMAQPKLLMLDEPSLGLAPVIVDKIFDIIQQISQMGTTILLVEQNVAASLDVAHRAYVIETGTTVIEGTSSDLKNNAQLQRAYLGL